MQRMSQKSKRALEEQELKKNGCACGDVRKALLVEISRLESLLDMRLKFINERLDELEKKKQFKQASINKLEDFNGEEAPMPEDNLKMNEQDKLVSILNAVKILPPNAIVDGRHTRENVTAICGFLVSEEQLDTVYANFSHEAA